MPRTISVRVGGEPPGLSIVQENALAGNSSTEWAITGAGLTTNTGFAREFSTHVGNTVQFSCTGAGTVIDIYRIGYYGGNGSRKVATLTNTATTQAAPTTISSSNGSVTCTDWSVTASWAIPADATPGLYIGVYRNVGLTNASWIPFVVRNDSRVADIIVKTSEMTWALAYNGFGGKGLYGSYIADGTAWAGGSFDIDGRGHAMDYHRPIPTRSVHPATYWMNAEYPLIRYLERNGFNVKYVSSKDVEENPNILNGAKVVISSGHDEYWCQGIRDTFKAVRDSGTHVLFMSGNEVFWRTRLVGNRLWCYKDTMPGPSGHTAGAVLDPVSWTGTWRDTRRPGGAQPEAELTGTFFRMNGIRNENVTLASATYGSHVAWRNSSLTTTDLTLTEVIGFEADEMDPRTTAPQQSLLAHRTFSINGGRSDDNGQDYTTSGIDMDWGIVTQRYPSGAVVVGFGTVQWAWALDNGHDNGGAYASLAAQQMMVNLLVDLGVTAPPTPISGITVSSPVSLNNYGLVP